MKSNQLRYRLPYGMRVPIFLAVIAVGQASSQTNARDLILRSATRDAADLELRRNYTWLETMRRTRLDDGKAKSVETRTFDISLPYGRVYRRLVEKDGKPLSPSEDRKEQQKMDREIAKRSRESEAQREKHRRELRKELDEERQFRQEIADAFHFELLPEETVGGWQCHVIRAEPKPGFRPRSRDGAALRKVRGKLWISKQDLRWVKLEAEFIDTHSLGWFLFRVGKGTRLSFEAAPVEGPEAGAKIWMPYRARVSGSGRVLGVKKLELELELDWSNYRRFQTDSRIVAAAAEP